MASSMSLSVGFGFFLRRAATAIILPGWQYPNHGTEIGTVQIKILRLRLGIIGLLRRYPDARLSATFPAQARSPRLDTEGDHNNKRMKNPGSPARGKAL